MSNSVKIITTVGTSIFTNYQDRRVANTLGRDYVSIDKAFEETKLQEKDGSDVPASGIYEEKFQPHIKRLKETIQDLWYAYPGDKPNTNASAEIASILKIAAQEEEPCEVHLIATDTLQSVLAAELIVGWFERFPSFKVSKVLFQRQGVIFEEQKDSDHVVKDLRVRGQRDYQNGYMNLIDLLDRVHKNKNSILNITGGYKAIIPVITLFGQLNEIPLKYLYGSDDDYSEQEIPVVLGNLPVHFDLSYIEKFVYYICNLESLEGDLKDLQDMYNLGLITENKTPTKLSVIGRLIKNKLISDDIPFQKTFLGYLVEYKVYEYYTRNRYNDFKIPILGYKLSNETNKDLEDADLWFENDKEEVIIAEIKSASSDKKKIKSKIKKILSLLDTMPNKKIKEFWIILYTFEDSIELNWCNKDFFKNIIQSDGNIKFKVMTLSIEKNDIDGSRNRIKYQEFMRRQIKDIPLVFEI